MNYLIAIIICYLFSGYTGGKSWNCKLDTDNKYKCSIITSRNGSQITFAGVFKNEKSESVKISYKFEVVKVGNAGNSNNLQSGEVVVKGNTKTILSEVRSNLMNNDIYKIKLKIFENNEIILSDSLEVNNTKK